MAAPNPPPSEAAVPAQGSRPRLAAAALLGCAALTVAYPYLAAQILPGAPKPGFFGYRLVPLAATIAAILVARGAQGPWPGRIGRFAASVSGVLAGWAIWSFRYSYAGGRGLLTAVATAIIVCGLLVLRWLPGPPHEVDVSAD